MSNIDLSRLGVLVVEDSQFIRSLIVNSLRVMGVGSIQSLDDGSQAIDFIKQVKDDPMKAGMMNIDLVISDWEMSPVDGMILLRWIRRHKDSPNRFVPFLMLTGYSEPKRVYDARAMGVNEFMSKPFTIKALADKLFSIINKPRQFVHTASYFGPDRRRQIMPFDGKNRRQLGYDSPEVEVING